jgi:hypothetical protein
MPLPVTPGGFIARALAAAQRLVDGAAPQAGPRMGRYGENFVLPLVPTKHLLADEGAYFVTNNAQTGIATAAAPTSFSDTNPFLLIFNTDQPGGKRIYLDYALLLATAAGTNGTNVQAAVRVDQTNRYTSGGTSLTANIVNVNADDGSKSIAQVTAGNITAVAATNAVRTLVGNRFLSGAIPVAGDQYTLNFGGVDGPGTVGISTIKKDTQNLPPVIIGPQECCLIHLWLASQSAASSYAPELGWWER